jgi:hypothetical protein
MSQSGKQKLPNSPQGSQSASTPGVFFPVVVGVPSEDFKLSDVQYENLEIAGGVKLSEHLRASLLTLAIVWIDDLRLRRTARPKQFRDRLDKMIEALSQAEGACRLNDTVGSLERHLLHWAMEAPVPGAVTFPASVGALELQIQTVLQTAVALRQCLPRDPGRQRPFEDEHRIISLADIFEQAGGKASVYSNQYVETGNVIDTPFRRFAQYFYLVLPADDKRDPGGLDQALRLALITRRRKRSVSDS